MGCTIDTSPIPDEHSRQSRFDVAAGENRTLIRQ